MPNLDIKAEGLRKVSEFLLETNVSNYLDNFYILTSELSKVPPA